MRDELVRERTRSLSFHPSAADPGPAERRSVAERSRTDYDAPRLPGAVLATSEAEPLEAETRPRPADGVENLGVMAGALAHDVANLLTSILGNVDLALAALEADAPARAPIRRIESTARRGTAMLRQLLASVASARRMRESVDLSRLVRDTLLLVDPLVPPAVTLRSRLADGLPDVRAHASQLEQVVLNLVANASEALGCGPGAIEVATGEGPAPGWGTGGTWTWVDVADTGPGMDAHTRERIFEPFFSTKGEGRGLGLASVQGIVRAHGGAVEVWTEPGRGTRFRIWLPGERSRGGMERP